MEKCCSISSKLKLKEGLGLLQYILSIQRTHNFSLFLSRKLWQRVSNQTFNKHISMLSFAWCCLKEGLPIKSLWGYHHANVFHFHCLFMGDPYFYSKVPNQVTIKTILNQIIGDPLEAMKGEVEEMTTNLLEGTGGRISAISTHKALQ